MPFTAPLPQIQPAHFDAIQTALDDLLAVMSATSDNGERIKQDSSYHSRLAAALIAVGSAFSNARLKDDIIEPRSWDTETSAEVWARAIVQQGFDSTLTGEALARWLTHTADGSEGPACDPVFFFQMRSCLVEFRDAVLARVRAETRGSSPPEHDGNFDLRRITGLGKNLVDLVRLARSRGETPPSNTLRTQLGRAAYELRVALDWTNRIRGYPSHIARFTRRNLDNPVAAAALSELWDYYWQVLHGLPDSRCPWPWQQPMAFTETEESRLTRIVETLERCIPDDEVSGHGQQAEVAQLIRDQGAEVNAGVLAPSRQKAMSQYRDALSKCLHLGTDREVYDWIAQHSDGDSLPEFATWARYLREARSATGTGKNTPRAGRTGRSIARPDDI